MIRVLTLPIDEQLEGREVVTILRKDLDTYMAVADLALVIKFDFTRTVRGSFSGWNDVSRYHRDGEDLFTMAVQPLVPASCTALWLCAHKQPWLNRKRRGAGILKVPLTGSMQFQNLRPQNDRNVETSASPLHIVSYFEQSDLPWQISPAFFRPEVLQRFKADPEKYTLEDRSISCRGAWHIKSYDINEAGQVHVYIGDLAKLPIAEQNYWKAFNEWPKSSISARAHRTDIEGQWCTTYDPLNSLRNKVRALDKACPEWWNRRGDALMDSVLAPATDSRKNGR